MSNPKRDFILNENVKEASVKDIIMGIVEVNRHDSQKQKEDSSYVREPITLIVNTFGGGVYDGFALASLIDTSETPVHTYLYGKAMSMGFLIFASGHKRFAHPLATLMYHEISTGLNDKIEGIKQSIEQSEVLQDTYDNYILSVSNVPLHKMMEARKYKRELYMTATEGFNYNLVDVLLKSTRQQQ
jgi:ATP-dependent Clp protease protease subunit